MQQSDKSIKTKNIDVLIFNLWPFKNYGGVLNAYALQQVINSFGYSSKLINWQYPVWREKYNGSFVEEFAKMHLNITQPIYEYIDLNKLNSYADIFVVGSDCVWSSIWFKDSLNFLPFVAQNKKRISYAPSFANAEYSCPADLITNNKYCLSLFRHISCREDSGVNILKEVYNVDATLVLDPTLLLDSHNYNLLLDNNPLMNRDYVFNYVISRNGCEYESVVSALKSNMNVMYYNQEFSNNMSVSDWISMIKHSQLLLTNSYHACCLAIIYNIPFWIFKPLETDFSRFESLMRILSLENRIVYNPENFNIDNIFEPIPWKTVNKIIDREKLRSMAWLKKALDS